MSITREEVAEYINLKVNITLDPEAWAREEELERKIFVRDRVRLPEPYYSLVVQATENSGKLMDRMKAVRDSVPHLFTIGQALSILKGVHPHLNINQEASYLECVMENESILDYLEKDSQDCELVTINKAPLWEQVAWSEVLTRQHGGKKIVKFEDSEESLKIYFK